MDHALRRGSALEELEGLGRRKLPALVQRERAAGQTDGPGLAQAPALLAHHVQNAGRHVDQLLESARRCQAVSLGGGGVRTRHVRLDLIRVTLAFLAKEACRTLPPGPTPGRPEQARRGWAPGRSPLDESERGERDAVPRGFHGGSRPENEPRFWRRASPFPSSDRAPLPS
jgi:hypothetical protein